MNSLVSIIIPCYNQAKFLPETLQSVLKQTFCNWECIIINDGSPDNTHQIAQEWVNIDNRFKYLNIKNSGVSNARNKGIQVSKGNYIQFLDADDILEQDKLLMQVKYLDEEKFVDIVYSSSRYFFCNNKSDLFAVHHSGVIPTIDISKEDKNQKEVLLKKNVCTICASLYRKEIFSKIQFKNVIYEDWLLHIECSFNGYVFHFERFEKATSFIRMTNQSQMLLHGQEQDRKVHFNNEIANMIENFDFKSKLNFYSFPRNQKKNFQNNKSIKVKIKLFIPPILLLIRNKIFKK